MSFPLPPTPQNVGVMLATSILGPSSLGSGEVLPTSSAITVDSLWSNAGLNMGELVMTGVLPTAKTGVRLAARVVGQPWSSAIVGPPVDSVGVYTGSVKVAGLANNTPHELAFVVDGAIQTANTAFARTCRTSGSSAYALGSCVFTTAERATWDAIRTFMPLAADHLSEFIMTGDLGYRDDTSLTVADMHATFTAAFQWPKFQALAKAMRMSFRPSDHDWAYESESDAYTTPADSRTTIDNGKTAFVQRVPFDRSPTVTIANGLASVWREGRILKLHVCERSERDAYGITDSVSKTMLGAAQKQLYKDCVVLAKLNGWDMHYFGDVSWNSTQPLPNPSWNAYGFERTELQDFVEAQGMEDRVIHHHGDFHGNACELGRYSKFSTSGLKGMVTICAAPLGRTESPGVATNFTEGFYAAGPFQFSTVDVFDTGGDLIEYLWRAWSVASATDPTITEQCSARWRTSRSGASTVINYLVDNFNDTAGTVIESHNSDTGGSWVVSAGYPTPASHPAISAAGRLYFPNSGTVGYEHTTKRPRAAMEIVAVFDCLSAVTGDQPGIMLRKSAVEDTCYLIRYSRNSTNWGITQITDGATAALGSTYTDAFTAGQSRTVKITIDDSITPTIKVFIDEGSGYVERLSYTDTTAPFLLQRQFGIRAAGGQTSTTGVQISSFAVNCGG